VGFDDRDCFVVRSGCLPGMPYRPQDDERLVLLLSRSSLPFGDGVALQDASRWTLLPVSQPPALHR
jgi:hypothetical protein